MTERASNSRQVRAFTVAAVTALTLASIACGHVTMGGVGSARVLVSGDAPDPASRMASLSSFPAASRSSNGEDDLEGEIEVDFTLFLVSETGDRSQLGDDDIRVRVDLEGRREADTVDQPVAAGTYTELQIIFTKIQVEIDAGLVVNGMPIAGEIDVELEDVRLLVSKTIAVTISDGGRADLLIDLNAPQWLQAVDPLSRTVDAGVFADLISVTTVTTSR